jgi:hypothetical protein
VDVQSEPRRDGRRESREIGTPVRLEKIGDENKSPFMKGLP